MLLNPDGLAVHSATFVGVVVRGVRVVQPTG
jgi:hypothetical protein